MYPDICTTQLPLESERTPSAKKRKPKRTQSKTKGQQ
jgi:hypothetical protein